MTHYSKFLGTKVGMEEWATKGRRKNVDFRALMYFFPSFCKS